MRYGGLAAVLALALLGGGGGYLAGHLQESEPVLVEAAQPVPASSPSIPIDPVRGYANDIDYSALEPALEYRSRKLGDPPYAWRYDAPRGWVATVEGINEIRWRPPDIPTVGGFSLRVKLTTEHKSVADMVEQKVTALEAGYEDVVFLRRTAETVAFRYRDVPRNRLRFNTFRWFSVPGQTEALFEMSVVGRGIDREGLDDLMEQVADSVEKIPADS